MNCDAFDSALLDVLYDELPADRAPELTAHTAECSACSKRLADLQKTRSLVRDALEVPLPESLEDRILRAAEETQAPSPNRRAARTGVVAFLSRPPFAIAAAFVLVLGATLLFSTTAKREAATTMAQAPADEARGAATAEAPAPPAPVASAVAPAEPAPAEPAPAQPAAAPQAPGALALNSPPPRARAAAGGKAAKPTADESADDPFSAAQALFYQGHYAEAQARFEALAPNNPHAELFAARCVAKLRGCEAARSRFDALAHRHPNTDVARRANAETARCAPKPSATSTTTESR